MEPFGSVVLAAVGTVTSGVVAGAGGEVGRRSAEALAGLWRRARGAEPAAEGGDGALPGTEEERRALAADLDAHARRSPEFAREVREWVAEAEHLAAARRSASGGFDAVRPQMLPPSTAVFTDREELIADVTRLAEAADATAGGGAPKVVVLSGPGGIGKSATTVHCAHLLKDRFPDGQLYVDLAGASGTGALRPSDALVRFLAALGTPPERTPADEHGQTALYRDRTADRRLLVVLDNAHSDAQVEPLLPASPHALVLVTSRLRPHGLVRDLGAVARTLPPLDAADSLRLLARIVGADRMAGSETSTRAVAADCGGVPLALCTTGAHVAARTHLTWETVARQLATGRGGETMGEDGNDGTPRGAVHRAHDVSYAELDPAAARLYRLAALWPWPAVTVPLAARAADVDEPTARALLDRLARLHLVEEVAEERYRYHDLVRDHARRKAEDVDGHRAVAAAVGRTVRHWLGFAVAADHRVIPARWHLGPAYLRPAREEAAPGGARDALAALARERDNLAAAVRAADHWGLDDLVWQLCEATWAMHLRLGFHEQWVDTHLLGVAAARRAAEDGAGDPRAEGRVLVQLAFAHMGLGRQEDAEDDLAQALAAEERAGHHRGRATALEVTGLLRLRTWRWPEAEACFEAALGALADIRPGDDGEQDVPRASAILAHHVGRALRGQGRHAEAVRRLHTALAAFRDLDARDRYNEGRVYMSLGETHLEADEPELARVCLDRAVDVMTQEGAALQLADAAYLRARCARRLDDPTAERADLTTAERLYEQADDYGSFGSLAAIRARLVDLRDPL
ncbi:tetratricopeptide repeat protein [Streptomyces sp. NPDC017979]|uniref:tetratricopeptide repeat protein n=1 Tax=Streptomyces sp. NPDC017979 TaxID=3365024 RepID=UPI00379C34EF